MLWCRLFVKKAIPHFPFANWIYTPSAKRECKKIGGGDSNSPRNHTQSNVTTSVALWKNVRTFADKCRSGRMGHLRLFMLFTMQISILSKQALNMCACCLRCSVTENSWVDSHQLRLDHRESIPHQDRFHARTVDRRTRISSLGL